MGAIVKGIASAAIPVLGSMSSSNNAAQSPQNTQDAINQSLNSWNSDQWQQRITEQQEQMKKILDGKG